MPVDQTLSNYSDLAFQTTFVVYAVALVLSLLFYGRMQGVIDGRRELAQAKAKKKELVAAGGVEISAAEGTSTSSDVAVDAADSADGDAAESGSSGGLGDDVVSADDLAKIEARADKLAGMTQALVWLGVVFHLAAVVLRGFATGRFPMGNLYEYVLSISLGVMIIAAVVLTRKSWRTLWPWLLTPMLALLFYGGTALYAESAPVVPALQSNWLPIHVTTVSIGGSIGIVSGVASLLYLLRYWQAPGKEKGFFGALAKPLPPAKKLDTFAYRTAIITLPVFGLGVLLGAIWAESAWGRFWGWDPKETVSLITWILYAAYLHARATAGWKAWGTALINIAALATMIFNLFFINLVVSGLHSYAGLN